MPNHHQTYTSKGETRFVTRVDKITVEYLIYNAHPRGWYGPAICSHKEWQDWLAE